MREVRELLQRLNLDVGMKLENFDPNRRTGKELNLYRIKRLWEEKHKRDHGIAT